MVAPRIALVGVGAWGQFILRDLRELGADVVAVARSDRSRGRALAGGATKVVSGIRDIGAGAVDGIVVATTIASHAEVLLQVLDLGVPVFCEKPLTDDPDAAADIVRRAGDRVFVMDKWRYHPGVRALAGIATRQELGTVVGLRCIRQGWGNKHREDADDVWVLVPHDLSIALEVLGELPEPVAARGIVSPEGVASMSALLGRRPWVAIEAGGMANERRRRVELLCEGGVAWLGDGWDTTIGVASASQVGTEEWEVREVGDELPLLAELRTFLEYLRGGPPPKSTAAEGAAIVRSVADLRRLAGLP